jgi:hypothetical protein
MEKANVTKFDLEAAFKALDDIETPIAKKGRVSANRVNLKERLSAKAAHEVLVEDYYDVNDMEDLEVASTEREGEIAKAKLARIEKIVDLDAETEDDILPSYVGKIIMQCPQCMTLFYKNEEDIETSEEATDVVNINEICQHCGNASGYTLVGKVGGIEEDEAENFDLDDLDVEEPAEEPVEEEPTEEGEVADEEVAPEEVEDDLDLGDLEELDLEEEPVEESMHNSKLLDKIEKDNDLKTDIESKHMTLNEEKLEDEEESEEVVEESMHNSELLKDIEKKNDLKTENDSEFTTLNEAADTEDAAVLEEVEDFDEESFNEHLNMYLTSVYSNVKCFEATACTMDKTNFIVEGKIKFNSGRQKTTKFIFESTKYGFRGENKDFAQNKAFTLNTRVLNKTLFTEGFTYNYRINESLVQGRTNR